MSFSIPRKIGRRSALRGVLGGSAITVGVPFLDCFLNSQGTALASGAPLPVRFGTWFWGLGFTPGRGLGETDGYQYSFGPETLALERHKNHINFFNSYNMPLDGKVSAVHYTGWVGARTGSVPSGFGHIPAPTIDVLVADAIGDGTRFRSLDVSATSNPIDSYSFRSTGSQNTAEVSPADLYARIFGSDFVDPNSSQFQPDPLIMARKSVLSAISDQSKSFTKSLGYTDRARMDEYFTSIRQVENQLALQLEEPAPLEACIRPPEPEEMPAGLEVDVVTDNHNVMSRILALAVACNQTRVFNMLYSKASSEVRNRGASFTHHILTHEEPPDPALGYQVETAKLNVKSMEALAHFLDEFSTIREGDGTLLDNVLIFAQTDTNDAKTHSVDGTPMMLIGSAGGRVKTGMYVPGSGDPISRVGLTAMRAMGVPINEWGTESLHTDKIIPDVLVNA